MFVKELNEATCESSDSEVSDLFRVFEVSYLYS